MDKVLVVFESKYGQAAKIADHIGESARDRGLSATVLHVDVARDVRLAGFRAVVVAPVYYGKHPRSIEAFVAAHRRVLTARRSAFVSVSNSAGSADPAAQAKADRVATTLAANSGARFDLVTTAGGAVAYPRYWLLLRLVMRLIAKRTGAPTDTAFVHELTDWVALDLALVPFLGALDGRAVMEATPDESGVHRIPGRRASPPAVHHR